MRLELMASFLASDAADEEGPASLNVDDAAAMSEDDAEANDVTMTAVVAADGRGGRNEQP